VINIAGPEKQGMDDFIRTRFAATGDARQVVTDADAQYYGAALDEVLRHKPSSSKGRYLKKITVSTTTGPGIPVDPAVVRNFSEG